MGYETLSGGLQLVIPTNGTKNWGTILKNSTWSKINSHTHTGGGDGNQLSGSAFIDHGIETIKLTKNFNLFEQAISIPDVGNTVTIDWDNGNVASTDLTTATGACNLVLLNPVGGASYQIILTQGATVHSLAWPASVRFPDGQEPTQFMEPNTVSLIKLEYAGADYLSDWQLSFS